MTIRGAGTDEAGTTEESPAQASVSSGQPASTPRWRLAIDVVRSILFQLLALLFALVLDGWMRFYLLPRYGKDERRWIAEINPLIRLWGKGTWHLTRIGHDLEVSVEGTLPESGRYLVLSNHQSSLDIPALLTYLPALNLKFVAMEELKYGKPAVSLALRNGGFAFVAKRSLREDLAMLKEFAHELERFRGSPAIFPEGIRTFDGEIRDFLVGGAETVRRICRLPILPVTIDGLWTARTIKELHLLARSRVTIRISDPVPVEEVDEDPRGAYRRIEQIIRSELDDIRGRIPGES
jgi:1-acyl-sn-glycerol-3-phosphate acyltransferase